MAAPVLSDATASARAASIARLSDLFAGAGHFADPDWHSIWSKNTPPVRLEVAHLLLRGGRFLIARSIKSAALKPGVVNQIHRNERPIHPAISEAGSTHQPAHFRA